MASHGAAEVFPGPHSSLDPWSEDFLTNPAPGYAELRSLGAAVWLDRYDMVALPRFAEVRAALANWQVFSSASGAAVDPEVNATMPGGALGSDPPEHTAHRRILTAELSARRVGLETERIRTIAAAVVEPLLGREIFDANGEIAAPYVATVAGTLLGLPDHAFADLPALASRAFNVYGPAGDRQRDGLQAFEALVARAIEFATSRDRGTPGEQRSAEEEIERFMTYTFPGIDTTVQAINSALYLFASHPDQWTLLRENPSLIPAASAEALRLHSPVRYFTRLTTEPTEVGGTFVAPKTRVLIMYGSANRDEQRFLDPDRFDITRPPHQHLAFGHGIHHCQGANLARREVDTLLEVLLPRVRRLELQGTPVWGSSLLIRGLERLDISFTLD